jgi:DNA-binding response OmpR family regulator
MLERRTMRALVVDDEVKMAAFLRRGLEEEGYAVELAASGPEAVWFATENPYDVIVLDVLLPDFDGFEVCRKLRGGAHPRPGRCHAHRQTPSRSPYERRQ